MSKQKDKQVLKVVQVKGAAKISGRQRETLKCLGLSRVGVVVEIKDTPSARGMLDKVKHLVSWEKE
jgi:large subunit ribosomal protein L30